MTRVLIVEDEDVVARRLERLVREILGARLASLRVSATRDDALATVREHPIDLLFLDLDLEGRDGFAVLAEAAAGAFQTIVVSARHDEALRAFEFGVTDFVPKPYDEERLRKAIARVTERDEALREHLRVLAVRRPGGIVTIPIDEVAFISGAGDYSRIHRADGSTALHDKSLTELERMLPCAFKRIHRSHVVDTRRIRKYRSEPGSRYFVVLDSGVELPVSRTRYRELTMELE